MPLGPRPPPRRLDDLAGLARDHAVRGVDAGREPHGREHEPGRAPHRTAIDGARIRLERFGHAGYACVFLPCGARSSPSRRVAKHASLHDENFPTQRPASRVTIPPAPASSRGRCVPHAPAGGVPPPPAPPRRSFPEVLPQRARVVADERGDQPVADVADDGQARVGCLAAGLEHQVQEGDDLVAGLAGVLHARLEAVPARGNLMKRRGHALAAVVAALLEQRLEDGLGDDVGVDDRQHRVEVAGLPGAGEAADRGRPVGHRGHCCNSESIPGYAPVAPTASPTAARVKVRPMAALQEAPPSAQSRIFDIPVELAEPSELLSRITGWVADGSGPRRVMYVNAHVLNQSLEQPALRTALNAADLVYCDGYGVRLAAKALEVQIPHRMTGADWVWDLASLCEALGLSVYLPG